MIGKDESHEASWGSFISTNIESAVCAYTIPLENQKTNKTISRKHRAMSKYYATMFRAMRYEGQL